MPISKLKSESYLPGLLTIERALFYFHQVISVRALNKTAIWNVKSPEWIFVWEPDYLNSPINSRSCGVGFQQSYLFTYPKQGETFWQYKYTLQDVWRPPTHRNEMENGSVNLLHSYKIDKKGREIGANIDLQQLWCTHYTKSWWALFIQQIIIWLMKTHLNPHLPASIIIKTAKRDYVQDPLRNKAPNWKSDLKTSFVNTDNTASFFDRVDNVVTPNYRFSNRFLYKENIMLFIPATSTTGKKFSLQAGFAVRAHRDRRQSIGKPGCERFHISHQLRQSLLYRVI